MSRIRQREIHSRRKRKEKLKLLRERLGSATGMGKEQVFAKLKKVAPFITDEEFTAMAKKR